jgi:4-diphosphocytidyl-2-C-methyl-D-erythritol kinase
MAGEPMTALHALAPGKLNLCLLLGPQRADGRHELVTLIESLSLADALTLSPAGGTATRDEVICVGVNGPNLAGQALARFRAAAGWSAPPQRLEILKRVPVAAGMGGGSADAAAALRLAVAESGDAQLGDAVARAIAPELGSDVPSQLEPGLALVTGGGEHVERLPALAPHAWLVLPLDAPLSTADVYAEADRLGLTRSRDELSAARRALASARELSQALLGNDLEPAARSLHPPIDSALQAATDAGAEHVMVSGSGPTVVGLFAGEGCEKSAQQAADALRGRYTGASAAAPVEAAFGAVRRADASQ